MASHHPGSTERKTSMFRMNWEIEKIWNNVLIQERHPLYGKGIETNTNQSPRGRPYRLFGSVLGQLEQVNEGQFYDGYREEILTMLQEFERMHDWCVGQFGITKHPIELSLPDIPPINLASSNARLEAREFEKNEIDRILQMNVIEQAQSEWASLIWFLEIGGYLWLCVKSQWLNAIFVIEAYKIPCKDKCIESRGETRMFSTPDANSGYWQI